MKKTRILNSDRIKRILIIKWSALGDAAIATTVMEDVIRAFPHATIDLNTLPAAARLFVNDARFNDVFCVNIREKGKRFRRWLQWIRRVRAGRYDLVIDLQRSDHTRILQALLLFTGHRIPHRIGNRGGFPYTNQPSVRDPQAHAIEQMRSALEDEGIPTYTKHPVIHASEDDLLAVDDQLEKHGLKSSRFAVLMPGSQANNPSKRWGWARYATLGRLLLSSNRIDKVVIVGGPDEVSDCEQIYNTINTTHSGKAVNLSMLPLLQIAPLCEWAKYIIANDTGNAHIAAAAAKPMIVLCGPTDPRRVRPVGERVRAIQPVFECINCYAKACRRMSEPECLIQIEPHHIVRLLSGDVVDGINVVEGAQSFLTDTTERQDFAAKTCM